MDKGYEKERFVSLSIKSPVAKKYRRFCKRKRASQSMALLSMLDFFEINGVSPEDRLGETITSLKRQIKQRFNAVVAIIRAVEKEQTKPTVAMLQSLFEQHLLAEEGTEDAFEFTETPFTDDLTVPSDNDQTASEWLEELTVPKIRYDRLEGRMNTLKTGFAYVLSHVKEAETSFGKEYLQLELSKEELEKYKRTLENI
ncbi:BfmA/BtgA family mobilization protein [Galbibacter sp. EGI 63066]|uniref:BfmA/BtgA family mobilization protein n=1 Tax=Galbibacter sp. EGI 63066 TaxID=2993559 RepID=UPI002248B57E|nr:BfmA/BtgA family mobilization protein [Galbibacter sp. EGI 63066]MCX2682176.1 BfmA/BtgA family mobilization protein [Galbibacter sp. EGI 63066]